MPIRNYEKDTCNVKRLVNDSFVPSAKQTSVIYSRLTDFYLQWLWYTTENWPAGRWYMYWVEKERDLPKSFDFCHLRVELMDFLSRHTHGDKTCQAHWTDIQKKIQKCFILPTGEILSGKIAQDKEESLVRWWAEITSPDFFRITKENTVVPRPTLYLC